MERLVLTAVGRFAPKPQNLLPYNSKVRVSFVRCYPRTKFSTGSGLLFKTPSAKGLVSPPFHSQMFISFFVVSFSTAGIPTFFGPNSLHYPFAPIPFFFPPPHPSTIPPPFPDFLTKPDLPTFIKVGKPSSPLRSPTWGTLLSFPQIL